MRQLESHDEQKVSQKGQLSGLVVGGMGIEISRKEGIKWWENILEAVQQDFRCLLLSWTSLPGWLRNC